MRIYHAGVQKITDTHHAGDDLKRTVDAKYQVGQELADITGLTDTSP